MHIHISEPKMTNFWMGNSVRRCRDESGAISIIFAASLFALFGIIGMAIDGARTFGISSRTQASLDAASLATAQLLDTLSINDTEAEEKANIYFTGALRQHSDVGAAFEQPRIVIDQVNRIVKVSVDVVVPTTFSQVLGFASFKFTRESTVVYKRRAIELAMVLDTTGSMSELAADGISKMVAMQIAATDVISTLLQPGPSGQMQNRVALAPFAASVNVGTYLADVAEGQSVMADTCVIERNGVSTTDEPLTSLTRARVMATPGYGMSGAPADARYSCPAGVIQPLTNDLSKLQGEISGYLAEGGTAGHLGTAWGWNLISPNFASVFTGAHAPAAYNDRGTIKAVLIMTDGLFNTAYKTSDAAPLATQTAESLSEFAGLCAGMKVKGVIVYTVGFGLSKLNETDQKTAKDTLEACASGTANFFDPETGRQLQDAFANIAEKLQSLRVSG
jgi:Flp pilus assembly protein TadG